MSKKIIYVLLFLVFFSVPSFAEKIPVKISPTKFLTTKNDQVEVGDWIPFEVVSDVYKNDQLYILKNTPVQAVVDFVHPNGWAGDSAEIDFKTFYTKDVDGNAVKIAYPLSIDGNIDMANNTKQIVGYFLICLFRGAEISLEPDSKIFNIFIDQ